MKIIYGVITTENIVRNVWVAKTNVTEPMKAEVTMQGRSEAEARRKLIDFLEPEVHEVVSDPFA